MARSRRSSRRRSRTRSRRSTKGASGLPLPSTLRNSDVGGVSKDNAGTLKVLKKSGKSLAWRNPTATDAKKILKPLTRTKKDQYYKKIDKALDDETKLRNILTSLLKEVQPPKSAYVK